jgi:hypothetical protein
MHKRFSLFSKRYTTLPAAAGIRKILQLSKIFPMGSGWAVGDQALGVAKLIHP